jgi:hypothetical protein
MQIEADDAVIDSQVEHFKAVARSRGLEAARTEFINRLIGESYWFMETFGARQTYELYQKIADQVIEP